MRQRLGQHFLIDNTISQKIVAFSDINKNDTVIEIGPGKGILTELISPGAKKLIAIELDNKLAQNLKSKFALKKNVEIINTNFLDFNLSSMKSSYKAIANLPYYIATPILRKILLDTNWLTATIMVQKEVGERIVAKPKTKNYGAFTLFCQYYCEPEVVLNVGPKAFRPPPKVDSVVLLITNKHSEKPDKYLFWLIKTCFQQRRKTILNSLSRGLRTDKPAILQKLKASNIDPALRPEYLTINDYKNLTYHLQSYIIPVAGLRENDKIW